MKASWLLWLLAAPAFAGNATVQGDIVIVNDPTGDQFDITKHPIGLGTSVCEFGALGLYTQKDDDYDAVFVFTTMAVNPVTSFLATTPQGTIVRQTDQGVSYGGWFILASPSSYGSAATLKHCAYLGPISQYPQNPDDIFSVATSPFGTEAASNVSGIGVLGHEFGHHWLVFAEYDLNDGMGPQDMFRGATMSTGGMGGNMWETNVHWSAYSDSTSVMYGNKVTDNFDGTFTISGEDHKYGQFDQYLMGLRAPSEVAPMLVGDTGTGHGYADFPLSMSQSQTLTGSAVQISVDDVIRATGVRSPAYPNGQHCWRSAFVIVTGPGQMPSAQDLATVDAYRQRWETWFSWATDGRGSVDTRLDAIDACPSDGGRTVFDAGQPDAGSEQRDAGQLDAGAPDAGQQVDAGPPPDAGQQIDDAGPGLDAGQTVDAGPDEGGPIDKLKPGGCGCQESPLGSLALALLFWLAASSRARKTGEH